MAHDTVWIIVPVYNAQKTLKKCVRSIQKQTYKNWRLVLVDDGSKDKSGKMCDKFAQKDDRIVAIHQANAGPSAARKTGVAQIPDESYCAFCDSDDWMPKNALELMVNEANLTGVDMVCGRMSEVYKNIKLSKTTFYRCFLKPGIYENNEMMSGLFSACLGNCSEFPVSLCGKIFKSSKIKPVVHDGCSIPKKFAEDLDVTLRTMPSLDRCSIINDEVYLYRKGGGTSRFMPEILYDSVFMYSRKKEYLKFYTGQFDMRGMISSELLTNAVTYLTMCKRFERYSQGSLYKETEYVCSLPEITEALAYSASKKTFWAYEGAWDCMAEKNIQGLEKIVIDYVEMLRQRTLFKKVIETLKK